MSGQIKLKAASLGGDITLTPTDTASNLVVTIPAAAGNMVVSSTALGFSPYTGMRNRIINGGMTIDQRNAGASVTVNSATDTYGVDRWLGAGVVTDGVFTMQQDSSAPAGFSNSLKITVTTADTSVTGAQSYQVQQKIEGFNFADLGWGTASAQTVTLSFWVRSSLTGTFGGALVNSAFNRSYPFTYTISAANTWEQKTITVAGDTSGTWVGATNGTGLRVYFGLGAADRAGTAGVWGGAGYVTATGAVSVIGTVSATWYITGVQLEQGSTTTPFEFRAYGQELVLCQRYLPCFKASAISQTVGSAYASTSTAGFATYTFKVTSRVPPTGVTVSSAGHFEVLSGGSGSIAITALTFSYASDDACTLATTVASGQNANAGGILRSSNASAQVQFTGCEL